jgi:excisionase family DNA binding protein
MTRVVRDNAMLTARDVARLLNINISTVRRWTNKGILKTYRIGPRGDRRFRREDVALFVVEQSDKENCDEVVL